MDAEFVFRDERGRPAALPSLKKWRDLTALTFSRRPPELVRLDDLYADLLRAERNGRGSHEFLRTAIVLKGALNRFFASKADLSKSRRVNAGGGTMKRLFEALAEFTGDLAAMPSLPREIGIPPSEHFHARFGILWVLSNLKVTIRPSALVAGSLGFVDTGLSLAQAAGGMPKSAYSEHAGFGVEEARSHIHRDAAPAYSGGESRFYQKIKLEIVKMLKDFVRGVWEDVKRKARFFVHPTWEGFEDIIQTAARYLFQFVKQIPPYVAPAYSLINGLRHTFNQIRAARDFKGLLKQFEPAAGPIAAYVNVVEQEARKRALGKAVDVATVTALTAFGFTIPLVAALGEPIMKIVTWTIGAVLRVIEKINLDAFLQKARRYFDAEPRLGEGPLRFQPAAREGLVHDAAGFNRFFEEGCQISPVVPLLTLNTGVCGALLTKIRLTGNVTDTANENAYLAALHYFDKARALSRQYLQDCGFTFTTVNGSEAARAVIDLALATPVMQASRG
ncbi:MAG: hypothetical protein ACRYHA_13215 [Janthinobacterium lividum]